MKVKIIKSGGPLYWYADKIGQIFDVKDKPELFAGELDYIHLNDEGDKFYIGPEDCVVVTDVSSKINQFIAENGNSTRDALNVALARIEALKAELGFWRGIAMGDDASDELDRQLEISFKREGF